MNALFVFEISLILHVLTPPTLLWLRSPMPSTFLNPVISDHLLLLGLLEAYNILSWYFFSLRIFFHLAFRIMAFLVSSCLLFSTVALSSLNSKYWKSQGQYLVLFSFLLFPSLYYLVSWIWVTLFYYNLVFYLNYNSNVDDLQIYVFNPVTSQNDSLALHTPIAYLASPFGDKIGITNWTRSKSTLGIHPFPPHTFLSYLYSGWFIFLVDWVPNLGVLDLYFFSQHQQILLGLFLNIYPACDHPSPSLLLAP